MAHHAAVNENFENEWVSLTEKDIAGASALNYGLILLLSFVYSVAQSSTTGQPLLR